MMRRRTLLLFALSLVGAGCAVATRDAIEAGETLILAEGRIRGLTVDGRRSFIGIPYAAAPIEARRFRPPQPVQPWPGTLDASGSAVSCMGVRDEVGHAEDCLRLDVFVPEVPSTLLPVRVMLDAGDEASSAPAADDAVAITVHYRVGALGFLAHSALTEEQGGSGNYGLMDQHAALHWVQLNVRAFGGDPDRVTLVGRGAAAGDACLQLLASDAEDLFQAVELENGTCGYHPLSELSAAHARGVQLAAELGCEVDGDAAAQLACLRAVPADAFVDEAIELPPASLATVDGVFLREDPRTALAAGTFASVSMRVGWDEQQGARFIHDDSFPTEDDYRAWLERTFGTDHAGAIEAVYAIPEDFPYRQIIPRSALLGVFAGQIVTDAFYGCPGRQLAETVKQFTTVDCYTLAYASGVPQQAAPNERCKLWDDLR